MSRQHHPFFDLRKRSLLRANLLVFLALILAVLFSGFPESRPTLLLLIPTALAIAGTAETVRCLQPRWSFYHGGVLLCLYMDLMAISIILFFLLYPYAHSR